VTSIKPYNANKPHLFHKCYLIDLNGTNVLIKCVLKWQLKPYSFHRCYLIGLNGTFPFCKKPSLRCGTNSGQKIRSSKIFTDNAKVTKKNLTFCKMWEINDAATHYTQHANLFRFTYFLLCSMRTKRYWTRGLRLNTRLNASFFILTVVDFTTSPIMTWNKSYKTLTWLQGKKNFLGPN
jgi:hypothetical protein